MRGHVAHGTRAAPAAGSDSSVPAWPSDRRSRPRTTSTARCPTCRQTPVRARVRAPRPIASSNTSSVGWRRKVPATPSASIVPLPPRVGISETAVAPHRRRHPPTGAATRPARLRARTAVRSSRNTRNATSRRPSSQAARRNWSTVIRLLSRSSASGCAVSSPIATSRRDAPDASAASASRKSPTRAPTSAGCDSTITRENPADRLRDGAVVGRRHRATIEKAAGVVQLDLPAPERGAQPRVEGPDDLVRNRADGRVALSRVLPEVAHHAAPGALATREEHGGDFGAVRPYRSARVRRSRHAYATDRAPDGRPARDDEASRAPADRRIGSHWDSGVQARNHAARYVDRAPCRGLGAKVSVQQRLDRHRAVLEPALREHRHVESRDGLDATRDDVALEAVQRRHVVGVSDANGMPSATSTTDGRVYGLKSIEAVAARRRVGPHVAPAQPPL